MNTEFLGLEAFKRKAGFVRPIRNPLFYMRAFLSKAYCRNSLRYYVDNSPAHVLSY